MLGGGGIIVFFFSFFWKKLIPEMCITGSFLNSTVEMCITGSFFKQIKQKPENLLSPAAGRTQRNTPNFFSPAVTKTRKKSQKCAQVAAI